MATQKKLVRAAMVLDSSGSMLVNKQRTIDAVNEYLSGLKADASTELTLTLFTFSGKARLVYDNTPIDRAPGLTDATYQPVGNTALYDAIAEAIDNLDRVDGDAKLVIIATDGQENASREYPRPDGARRIRELIASRRTQGWDFAFLGAPETFLDDVRALGIDVAAATPMSASNVQGVLADASRMYRGNVASNRAGMHVNSTDRVGFSYDVSSPPPPTADEATKTDRS